MTRDELIPDWRTSDRGTRVRAALWLASEVGTGRVFTKAQLRAAFPGVEQIDRRVRDLRSEDWVIATAREDASLEADELRLVSIGGRVWEPSYRSRASLRVGPKERVAAIAAADYMCEACGTGAGEPFIDQPAKTAKLGVVRGGRDEEHRVLCDRCRIGGEQLPSNDALLKAIREAPRDAQDELLRRINAAEQTQRSADQLWARYRRLSPAMQAAIRNELGTPD